MMVPCYTISLLADLFPYWYHSKFVHSISLSPKILKETIATQRQLADSYSYRVLRVFLTTYEIKVFKQYNTV